MPVADSIFASLLARQRGLIVCAAPLETAGVLTGAGAHLSEGPSHDWRVVDLNTRWSLVQSGVGKVNAALCVARCVDAGKFGAVVSLGIAGSLPPKHAGLRSIVIADQSVYADEGIALPEDGFMDMSAAGFGPGGVPLAFAGVGLQTDRPLAEAIAHACRLTSLDIRRAPIATVSTCSGTRVRAEAVARRTGATAEAMEGAAVGHALARCFGDRVRFGEVRVVSNTTGDRHTQMWDIRGAKDRLADVARAIITA